jgi:DNA-binding CsgD family transcriptional regulator
MKNQKIIKICEQRLIYLNYSPRTKENYISHIKRFLQSLGDKQIIRSSITRLGVWCITFLI